uniref:Uncharacterized protein n=2 Tax=Plectus sambesii TaxID=2011161 RepID=A0A914UNB1_9BILA
MRHSAAQHRRHSHHICAVCCAKKMALTQFVDTGRRVRATRVGSGERKKVEEAKVEKKRKRCGGGDAQQSAAALRSAYELPVGRASDGAERRTPPADNSRLAWCGAHPGFSVLSLCPPIASYASAGSRPESPVPRLARALAPFCSSHRVRSVSLDLTFTCTFVQLSSSNEPATTSTRTTMRLAGRRHGRIQLQLIGFSALLLLASVAVVDGVPLRIANDGVDSVVLAPIGRETIIIDTASNFHAGLRAFLKAHQLRRFRQKTNAARRRYLRPPGPSVTVTGDGVGQPLAPGLVAELLERIDSPMELIEIRLIDDNSSVPLLIDIQKVESDEQAQEVQGGERLEDAFPLLPPINEMESKESGSGEAPADTLDAPPNPSPSTTASPTPAEQPYEECLNNERWLDADTFNKLKHRQRKLSRMIRSLNRQMDMYCLTDKNGASMAYRKCSQWREEKMFHYYKLMRLTYCSDYSKWPNAQRIKRSFGALFPLLERLYAFWE